MDDFDPEDLIGMTKDEAYALLSDYGYTLRIAKEDGKYVPCDNYKAESFYIPNVPGGFRIVGGPDVDMKRFNLSLQDGKVIEINGVG
jgi:hypothetical protein